jgi:multicomponent Na+:H+ antiporter subunit C
MYGVFKKQIMILLIILIAFYGLIISENLIKKVMCLNIIQNSIILFFVRIGYLENALPPILTDLHAEYVDPLPQALMLTAIVIGVCFNTLALTIIVKIYYKYNTVEVSKISER